MRNAVVFAALLVGGCGLSFDLDQLQQRMPIPAPLVDSGSGTASEDAGNTIPDASEDRPEPADVGEPVDVPTAVDAGSVEADVSLTDAGLPDTPQPDVVEITDSASPDVVATDTETDAGPGDTGPVCDPGQTWCGVCVDLLSATEHCGACGNSCSAGQVCLRGNCRIEAPQRSCTDPETIGCGLVSVPGGTFTMGDDNNRGDRPDLAGYQAQPSQPGITVSAFEADRYEVTISRFREFWTAGHPMPSPVAYPNGTMLPMTGRMNSSAEMSSGTGCLWGRDGNDDRPMNCVNWTTAQAFCVWDGGRLPTEAEWEFMARGTDGRAFPWGNDFDPTMACWSGGSPTPFEPCEIRGFSDSPYGAHDVAGNVSEWTADYHQLYTHAGCWGGAARMNPLCTIAGTGRARVLRGGNWWSTAGTGFQLSDRREGWPEDSRPYTVGFRCVRSH